MPCRVVIRPRGHRVFFDLVAYRSAVFLYVFTPPPPPDFDASVQGDPDTMADADAYVDADADTATDVDAMDVFDTEENEIPLKSSAREVKGLHIDMEVGSVKGKDTGRAQRARERRARMNLVAECQFRNPLEREIEFLFTLSLLS